VTRDQQQTDSSKTGNTLQLFITPAGKQQPLDGAWRMGQVSAAAGAAGAQAAEDWDDSAWEVIRPPHLGKAVKDKDTLWYRTRFQVDLPAAGQRLVLRFGGAFYFTGVWLNGEQIGEHAGYFQPFGFDVTEAVRAGENLLAVRCRFPVEAGSFRQKTALAGVFADWDCKPYPSTFYPDLPAPYEWHVPVGLWQPVSLWNVGPVLVESLNVFPEVINPHWPAETARAERAHLRIRLGMRSLAAENQTTRLHLKIEPVNFSEAGEAVLETTITLAAGAAETIEYTLDIENPRLWLPWTQGEPWLYRVRASVGAEPPVEQVFGVRQVEAVIDHDRWEWRLNGRRIFPKGSNYISDFFLDRATRERLEQDIELAQNANLDLLRVHAHIEPAEFYRQCDARGMLVWCDFPQIWTYAYDLPQSEQQAFDGSVLRQAADMVEMLGSHPSIMLWSLHNEPPWTPDGSFLGREVHSSRTNQEVDRAAAALVQALDPTRPALAASGEFDRHLYHGWYTGHWQDHRHLHPTFPTEFGVQALPDPASRVWESINQDWPVPADDPSWAYAGYQSIFFASPGVGPPGQFTSLEHYSAVSQAYQAFYIRYVIGQWRKQKFAPTGGYIHHFFADCFPGLTWSVLDYDRRPKAGFQALAQASRPIRLVLDLEEGYHVERVYRLVFPKDSRLKLRMLLVNDDYRQQGEVEVRWWLEPKGRTRLVTFLDRILGRHQTLLVRLPGADQAAKVVGELDIPLGRTGVFVLRTEVRRAGQVLDDNFLSFRVGEKRGPTRVWRRIPRFLVNKVYRSGSLRNTHQGFEFMLHNPAMPVTILRLGEMKVDSQPVAPEQVEITTAAGVRSASEVDPEAPFLAPSGEDITVWVQSQPLSAGLHTVEVTAELVGFGEITAEIRDRISPNT
jgi:beta-mannosidase